MANLSVLLNSTITVTDTTITPNPQIITRSLNNPTFVSVATFYDAFFQVGTSATTVPLPAPLSFIFYVKNLASPANVLINLTPSGGVAVNVGIVGPGAVFLIFPANSTAGAAISGITNGFTAVSLTASAAATSVEILVSS